MFKKTGEWLKTYLYCFGGNLTWLAWAAIAGFLCGRFIKHDHIGLVGILFGGGLTLILAAVVSLSIILGKSRKMPRREWVEDIQSTGWSQMFFLNPIVWVYTICHLAVSLIQEMNKDSLMQRKQHG